MRKLRYYTAKILLSDNRDKSVKKVADEIMSLFSEHPTSLVPDKIAIQVAGIRLSDDEVLFRLQYAGHRGRSLSHLMNEFAFYCSGDKDRAARLMVYSMKIHKNRYIAGPILREIADNGPYAALLKKWGKKTVKSQAEKNKKSGGKFNGTAC